METEQRPIQQPGQTGQTVIINQIETKSNGIGVAGFVFALITLFLGWIPVLGWILWVLGLIFSLIGVFRTPRGFAIAGLIISLIGVIIIIVVVGSLAAIAGLSM